VAEVYGSARPRKRWGRRLLITFLVFLLIVAGILVVADRVGASYAERTIGDRVAQQLTDQQATSEQPDVTIAGVPFLTQVLAGKYQEIKILLDDFSGPAGNGKNIKMDRLDIRAKDVNAPLDTVRTGNGDIVAGTVTGVGTLGYGQERRRERHLRRRHRGRPAQHPAGPHPGRQLRQATRLRPQGARAAAGPEGAEGRTPRRRPLCDGRREQRVAELRRAVTSADRHATTRKGLKAGHRIPDGGRWCSEPWTRW
jgi:hypothetical protein